MNRALRGGGGVTKKEARIVTAAYVLDTINDFELKNAPENLFFAGDPGLLKTGPKVSIVGSRRPTEEGLRRTRLLATQIAKKNAIVVSGLAAGIDTTAHRAAIAADGRTIAVIGTPLDQVYPKENAELQALIAREHLLVSQFPSGRSITKASFPMRNRTMALLSDVTVIVEAGEKSGTLHQGWEAIRLGRPLFLMESVVTDPTLTWPKEMIRYGAQVLSRKNLEIVLENLPSFEHVDAVAFPH